MRTISYAILGIILGYGYPYAAIYISRVLERIFWYVR